MPELEWRTPPPPGGITLDEYGLDSRVEYPVEWIDAWRWQDLNEDEALRLDMTDGGFNWTQSELDDVLKMVNLSSSLSNLINDRNITQIAKLAGVN